MSAYESIILSKEELAEVLGAKRATISKDMSPQPRVDSLTAQEGFWYPSPTSRKRKHYASQAHWEKGGVIDFCPYKPGDRLWVKEKGFWFTLADGEPYPRGACAGEPLTAYDMGTRDFGPGARTGVFYESDCSVKPAILADNPWMPAKAMPLWASRIDLEVLSTGMETYWDFENSKTIWEWVIHVKRTR